MTSPSSFTTIGIGSPIVDIIARIDDAFIEQAYTKLFEYKEIFGKLFNDNLDIGFVANDNLDDTLLKDDGFGYVEQYLSE